MVLWLSVVPSNFPRACKEISTDTRTQDVNCGQRRLLHYKLHDSSFLTQLDTHMPRSRPSEHSAVGLHRSFLYILRMLCVEYQRQTLAPLLEHFDT